jgi:hypothetical protein
MSRLSDDFNMYYHNTYIGYKAPGQDQILPFYIDDVRQEGSTNFQEYDEDEWDDYDDYSYARDNFYDNLDSHEDYSDSAYDGLSFQGHILTNDRGSTQHVTVTGFDNPLLVFKNPLLGYVRTAMTTARKIWGTYVSTRSVKKGLSSNRVNIPLNNFIVYHIFDNYDDDRFQRDYWLETSTGYVKYRYNTIVAIKDPNIETIYVDPLARHLMRDLERAFPTCQIIEQEL